jgi:hypothetical protein
MSTVRWEWRPGRAGYAAHLGCCSVWVQLETYEGPDGMTRAVAGAARAQRFQVAIVGPAGVERYWLRGSLESVRAKLSAALARRAAVPRPAPPAAALDWRHDGPWFAPFHERSPDAP